jgi:hypothetical protein
MASVLLQLAHIFYVSDSVCSAVMTLKYLLYRCLYFYTALKWFCCSVVR